MINVLSVAVLSACIIMGSVISIRGALYHWAPRRHLEWGRPIHHVLLGVGLIILGIAFRIVSNLL